GPARKTGPAPRGRPGPPDSRAAPPPSSFPPPPPPPPPRPPAPLGFPRPSTPACSDQRMVFNSCPAPPPYHCHIQEYRSSCDSTLGSSIARRRATAASTALARSFRASSDFPRAAKTSLIPDHSAADRREPSLFT